MSIVLKEIKQELSIDEEGKGYISRRGLARLCGVSDTSIYNPTKNSGMLKNILLSKSLSKPLKAFAGQDFILLSKLPDILCTAIIKHYAYQGKEQAQEFDFAFSAVGLRTLIRQELDWSEPQNNYYDQIQTLKLENQQLKSEIKNLQNFARGINALTKSMHTSIHQQDDMYKELKEDARKAIAPAKYAVTEAKPRKTKKLSTARKALDYIAPNLPDFEVVVLKTDPLVELEHLYFNTDFRVANIALYKIKETEAFKRMGYKTFKEYCAEQLQLAVGSMATKVMAGEVLFELQKQKVEPLPQSEIAAYWLSKVPKKDRVSFWRNAVASENEPSGACVKNMLLDRFGTTSKFAIKKIAK